MLAFARYSFNRSHAAAYGIIAYMTAKQKAYYPAEFYAGLCNSYLGKSSFVKDNAQEIMEDVERHRVVLRGFDYKQDHRKCSVQDGQIVYGIPLIKDCNVAMGEILHEVSKTQHDTFFELVTDIMSQGMGKKQLEILIRLDFFSEFGNSNALLHMMGMYDVLKFGEAKQISKDKAAKYGIDGILPWYATGTNKDGSESKSFKMIMSVDRTILIYRTERK